MTDNIIEKLKNMSQVQLLEFAYLSGIGLGKQETTHEIVRLFAKQVHGIDLPAFPQQDK